MGEVHQIVSKEAVDGAWEAYRAHAARSFDNKRLLLDRGFMEQWAMLEERFKRLANMPRKY
jgi:hypothetical protein